MPPQSCFNCYLVFNVIRRVSATWVGGGFINGTSEYIARDGFVWCQAPFGYAISLFFGSNDNLCLSQYRCFNLRLLRQIKVDLKQYSKTIFTIMLLLKVMRYDLVSTIIIQKNTIIMTYFLYNDTFQQYKYWDKHKLYVQGM